MGDEWPMYDTDENKQYRMKPIVGKTLRFTIKAAHDAHIALSNHDEATTPMIEIFIGGWENQGSAVRFVEDVVKVDTPDILSEDEDREFWIDFFDNHVRVGKGEDWEPFMECAIPEPYEAQFFGYTTAWGSTGTWQFFNERPTKATDDELSYNFEPTYGTTFTFGVSCANDAHVALTTGPEETQPMIELFIGGWANEKSAIRLNKDKEQTVATVDTSGILCCDEERFFWVTFKNGNIRVGKRGDTEPFMEHSLDEPFKVTHAGICTGWGATGQWRTEV